MCLGPANAATRTVPVCPLLTAARGAASLHAALQSRAFSLKSSPFRCLGLSQCCRQVRTDLPTPDSHSGVLLAGRPPLKACCRGLRCMMQSIVLHACAPLLPPLLALLWPFVVPMLTMSSTNNCLHAKHPPCACEDASFTAAGAAVTPKDGPAAHQDCGAVHQ